MKGTDAQDKPRAFAYQAQTAEGDRLDGRITAASADAARWKLQAMGLRVIELGPAPPPVAAGKGRALSGDDFAAFNQQLAQLAEAGLPIEQGLRLIAQDLGRGRLAQSVRDVAADLEAGLPLDQAFDRHAGRFPTLYGRLIEAGVRTGNLSAMLLNLGRHLDMLQRLRRSLWEAAAYPVMVVIAAMLMLGFVGLFIVPPMRETIAEMVGMFDSESVRLPVTTQVVFFVAEWAGPILVIAGAAIIGAIAGWAALRRRGRTQYLIERYVLPMPLIGPMLARNLAARWCDAAALAVDAGFDLPGAIELAADATGSPLLDADSDRLIDALTRGGVLGDATGLRVLGASVAATLDNSAADRALGDLLRSLRDLYRAQAEYRLGLLNAMLRPTLIVGVAVLLGTIITGLFMPLVQIINSVQSVTK